MDRKDDMDLESLKNMLSDVPDTDEFDLDSIIAEVSGQAPAKAAEPMPKVSAEPEKPVEPQPAPAAETKAEEPKTAPRNKKDKTAKKAAETAAAAEQGSCREGRRAAGDRGRSRCRGSKPQGKHLAQAGKSGTHCRRSGRGRGRYQAGRSRGGYARGTPPFGHSVVPVAAGADPCRSCRVSQLCTEL